MTRQQARDYIDAVSRKWSAEPCKHGHLGCALYSGGMCSDELAQIHNLDSDYEDNERQPNV